jgi:hypothetical protein
MTVDDVIRAYLVLRAQKQEMEERHKLELAPLHENLGKCQLWIQAQLQQQGLQNFKSHAGIAFLQTDTRVKAEDWDTHLAWIKDNDAWAFLERRVSKTVVQEYIEAHNAIPPGLSVKQEVSVHIRKS